MEPEPCRYCWGDGRIEDDGEWVVCWECGGTGEEDAPRGEGGEGKND